MNHDMTYQYLFPPSFVIGRPCALTTVAEHSILYTIAYIQALKWELFPSNAVLHTMSELLLLHSQLLHQIPATSGLGQDERPGE